MIERLVRPHLRTFQSYKSARSETTKAKILLDANESSLGSPVGYEGIALHRYPDPNQYAIRSALAQQLKLDVDRIFCGVGSDEIIDLLIRLVCEPPNDEVAILEPTYGMYRVAAGVNNIPVVGVPLDEDFQVDLRSTAAALSARTKILFCCSPNNPTGNLLRTQDVLGLCKTFPGLVIVDEAYIDFSEEGSSVFGALESTQNLVVLRTMSKARGLAGLRLGYCLAHPEIIAYLFRIKAPYTINAMTSHLAIRALAHEDFLRSSVQGVRRERERLCAALQLHRDVVRIYPSDSNFLLVEFVNAERVFRRWLDHGIAVRQRNEARLTNCLRITVGTEGENNLLLKTLQEIL